MLQQMWEKPCGLVGKSSSTVIVAPISQSNLFVSANLQAFAPIERNSLVVAVGLQEQACKQWICLDQVTIRLTDLCERRDHGSKS